jgi:stage II sporulation protein AB (anti-sigma F factor)
MMTFQSPGTHNPGKPSLHVRIPPDARHARTVRDALIAFSSLHGVADADLEAMLFAVGEALANAIEHGEPESDIDVAVEIEPEAIRAKITDRGAGLAVAPPGLAPLPEGLAERGRGIPIMQRFTDRFDVLSAPGEGTTVTLLRFRSGHDQERSTAS